jgi:hypothetical protein
LYQSFSLWKLSHNLQRMIGNNDVVPPGIHMTETPSSSAVHEGQCIIARSSRISYAAAPSLRQ